MQAVYWQKPEDKALYQYLHTMFANQTLMIASDGKVKNAFNLYFKHSQQLILESANGQQVSIDFTAGKYAHRLRFGGGRQQTLSKACGLHKKNNLSILDATAGLGQDAFVLASLNSNGKIVLCEQHPAVFALLDYAIKQGTNHIQTQSICKRMSAMNQDATLLMQKKTFDVIYLDPMYPERKKKAKVKKGMQLLQQLIAHPQKAPELLDAAIHACQQRVVVKRPLHAEFYANKKADFSHKSKNTRFDIYLKEQT